MCKNSSGVQATLDQALDAVALKVTNRDSYKDIHPLSNSDNTRSFVGYPHIKSGSYIKIANVSEEGDPIQKVVKAEVNLYVWNNKTYDIGSQTYLTDSNGDIVEPSANFALGKTNLPIKVEVSTVALNKNNLVTGAYTIPYTYTISPTCEIKIVEDKK